MDRGLRIFRIIYIMAVVAMFTIMAIRVLPWPFDPPSIHRVKPPLGG